MAQHYAPEEVSGAILATDLAEDLVARGHDVSFVTGAPSYPGGRVFRGYRNCLYQRETRDGVRVGRVWSFISPRTAFWSRSLNHGTFSVAAFYGGLLAGKPDLIFSYSPPLTLGVSALLLRHLWRVPWVLRVEDLYPEAAVAAGMVRSRLAVGLLSVLERALYRDATHISLISEGFRTNLVGKGVPSSKLSVTSVWADPDEVRPQARENRFRRKHGLQGKFVVMYAGTLGLTSALEDVLSAARHLQDDPDIRFVLVGEGVKKENLVRLAREDDLANVMFLPFQPRARFSEMMAAADVSLVTLNPSSSPFSLPSKTFAIMASARPILAVAPLESEVSQLVKSGDCGVVVRPGQPLVLAGTVRDLKRESERLERLGANGRDLLRSRFSRRRCVDRYEAMLKQVLA
jgi:colanic acid biosynthesis glycosyl transferase WcaI